METAFSVKDSQSDIVFSTPGAQEFMRLCSDGRVFVRGELVASNQEVYRAFLTWLHMGVFPGPAVCPQCGSQVLAPTCSEKVWEGVEWPT